MSPYKPAQKNTMTRCYHEPTQIHNVLMQSLYTQEIEFIRTLRSWSHPRLQGSRKQ